VRKQAGNNRDVGTKYQAPNMELEVLNGANDDTLQNSLASDTLRYRYDKLRTADSDGDKSHVSNEISSNISGFDNPEGISSSSHHNLHWHRKSSTKYPAIRGQQNTHFSSGDQHYPEKFQKLTQTAYRLCFHFGTDPRMKKTIHTHTDSLEVRKKGANHQGTADKVKGNSLHSMKPIYRHQTTNFFKSRHGLAGSNAMKFGEATQGEAVRHKRTEDYIHSQIEPLKAAAKREIAMEENARRNENREVNRKSEESLSHNKDEDDSDHMKHNTTQTENETVGIRKIHKVRMPQK
jgi:hypothetical protein